MIVNLPDDFYARGYGKGYEKYSQTQRLEQCMYVYTLIYYKYVELIRIIKSPEPLTTYVTYNIFLGTQVPLVLTLTHTSWPLSVCKNTILYDYLPTHMKMGFTLILSRCQLLALATFMDPRSIMGKVNHVIDKQ